MEDPASQPPTLVESAISFDISLMNGSIYEAHGDLINQLIKETLQEQPLSPFSSPSFSQEFPMEQSVYSQEYDRPATPPSPLEQSVTIPPIVNVNRQFYPEHIKQME